MWGYATFILSCLISDIQNPYFVPFYRVVQSIKPVDVWAGVSRWVFRLKPVETSTSKVQQIFNLLKKKKKTYNLNKTDYVSTRLNEIFNE